MRQGTESPPREGRKSVCSSFRQFLFGHKNTILSPKVQTSRFRNRTACCFTCFFETTKNISPHFYVSYPLSGRFSVGLGINDDEGDTIRIRRIISILCHKLKEKYLYLYSRFHEVFRTTPAHCPKRLDGAPETGKRKSQTILERREGLYGTFPQRERNRKRLC